MKRIIFPLIILLTACNQAATTQTRTPVASTPTATATPSPTVLPSQAVTSIPRPHTPLPREALVHTPSLPPSPLPFLASPARDTPAPKPSPTSTALPTVIETPTPGVSYSSAHAKASITFKTVVPVQSTSI